MVRGEARGDVSRGEKEGLRNGERVGKESVGKVLRACRVGLEVGYRRVAI